MGTFCSPAVSVGRLVLWDNKSIQGGSCQGFSKSSSGNQGFNGLQARHYGLMAEFCTTDSIIGTGENEYSRLWDQSWASVSACLAGCWTLPRRTTVENHRSGATLLSAWSREYWSATSADIIILGICAAMTALLLQHFATLSSELVTMGGLTWGVFMSLLASCHPGDCSLWPSQCCSNGQECGSVSELARTIWGLDGPPTESDGWCVLLSHWGSTHLLCLCGTTLILSLSSHLSCEGVIHGDYLYLMWHCFQVSPFMREASYLQQVRACGPLSVMRMHLCLWYFIITGW